MTDYSLGVFFLLLFFLRNPLLRYLIVVITTIKIYLCGRIRKYVACIWRITRIYLKYVKDTAKFEQFYIFIATVTVLNLLLHYLNLMTCFYTMFAVLKISRSCAFNLQNIDLFRGTSVHKFINESLRFEYNLSFCTSTDQYYNIFSFVLYPW